MQYQQIINHIKTIGSENKTTFGGDYEGGYYIQQVPIEVSGLIYWLLSNGITSFENVLEIGSAAGGFLKLLNDYFNIDGFYIVDDNALPTHTLRKHNLQDLNYHEFVGSSHSTKCIRQLRKWNTKFDLVHIDGDSDYMGIRDDTILVRPHLKDDALVLFHNIESSDGASKWFKELKMDAMPEFEFIKSWVNPNSPKNGIGLFRYKFNALGQ